MSFNIFYGGDELNLQTRQFCRDAVGCPETLDQVAEAIRASGADVVGLEEATMNTCLLAEKLGWHCSPRTQIISRYPISDPPGANGLYVFVEPSPGRVVAVSDVHLPADPYGPYEIRDGATLAEVLPNPVAKPGFTWTPGSPEGERVEVHDRIDWVLSMLATAIASKVVGEGGNPNTDIAVDPWPSDHRGIVSTLEVTPAPMPVLVAVEERSRDQGQTLHVRFHGGASVALVRGGTTATAQSTGGAVDGTLSFATTNLASGAYQAVLRNSSGQALSRSPFWLYAPGSVTTVKTAKSVYKVGEPIKVSWRKAPGMKFDWLGLYSAGENADNPTASTCSAGFCGNGHYFLYTYTHNTIEGSTTFDASSFAGWKTWGQIARARTRSAFCSTTVTAPLGCRRPLRSSTHSGLLLLGRFAISPTGSWRPSSDQDVAERGRASETEAQKQHHNPSDESGGYSEDGQGWLPVGRGTPRWLSCASRALEPRRRVR
jgi:hypothetical protein